MTAESLSRKKSIGIKNKTGLVKQKKHILSEEPEFAKYIPKKDVLKLLYELQVHQIELEMQYEELRQKDEEMKQYQAHLEEHVEKRTVELIKTVEELKREARERKRAEHSLRQYAERMKALSRCLFNAQESERRHIALELHDEIGQSLTGIKLSIGLLAKALPEEMNKGIAEAKELAGKLIERVRSITLDLRPPMLDDFGLLHSLLWHFERCTSQTNVRVLFTHSGLEGRFSPDVEIAAFRVVQEALTNAVRHASVDEVNILIAAKGNTLNITVEDKGTGFDLKGRTAERTTAGLSGMRERLRLVGGQLMINTLPGVGTRVIAEIPIGEG